MSSIAASSGTERYETVAEYLHRVAAYHEAGHVAVALALGAAIRGVTIVENGRALSHPYHWSPPLRFQPESEVGGRVRNRLEVHLMIALAGGEAARLHVGDDGAVELLPEYTGIVRMALCLARGEKHEAWALIEWLRLRTYNLLRRDGARRNVEAVARALLERKTLTTAELRSICTA